jgi:3',5'-cyclic AMP phosphodiesterase CpdA
MLLRIVAFAGLFCLLVYAAKVDGDHASSPDRSAFTVVLLPDTQKYTEAFPHIFVAQTAWIRRETREKNIKFAIHLGDITEDNLETEWKTADKAMGQLEGVVPYSVLPGNHDGINNGHDTHNYNATFPPSRFAGRPWYGGHRGETNDNNYCFLNAAGISFLIVSLEYGPTDDVLAWANALVAKHPDKQVIVATHCYMYHDDTRLGPGDDYSPHKKSKVRNDGEQMWEKFIKRHRNIFLVVSGHVKGDGAGRLISEGDAGNKVHQVLANYQTLENGGNGWLRTLKFVPEENEIRVTAYSPTLDEFNRDDQHSFVLDYDMGASKR